MQARLAASLASLGIATSAAASTPEIEPLLITGDAAPGTTGVVDAGGLEAVVARNGTIATHASLQIGVGGVTAANDEVIYRWDPGAAVPQIVVRKGDPELGGSPGSVLDGPGLPDTLFGSLSAAGTNADAAMPDGRFVFYEQNGTTGPHRYYRTDAGGLPEPFFSTDDPVAGISIPGIAYSSDDWNLQTNHIDLHADGTVVINTRLELGVGGVTGLDDRVVYTGTPGNLTLVARQGTPLVEPAGAEFRDWVAGEFLGDDLIVRGFLVPGIGGIPDDDNQGVWRWNGSSLDLIARKGDPAPIPGTEWFVPELGADGSLLFGRLRTGVGGVTDEDAYVLFRETTPGVYALLVRAGDVIPGLFDQGMPLAVGSISDPRIGADGVLHFIGGIVNTTTGFQAEGVIDVDASGTILGGTIVTAPLVVLPTPFEFEYITDWAANDEGDAGVLITILLIDPVGGTATESQRLRMRTRDGQVFDLAREGEAFAVSGGQLLTPTGIRLVPKMSDLGEFVFLCFLVEAANAAFRVTPPAPQVPALGAPAGMLALGLLAIAGASVSSRARLRRRRRAASSTPSPPVG